MFHLFSSHSNVDDDLARRVWRGWQGWGGTGQRGSGGGRRRRWLLRRSEEPWVHEGREEGRGEKWRGHLAQQREVRVDPQLQGRVEQERVDSTK